jgi:uncharacterized protein (TIGR01777 family)
VRVAVTGSTGFIGTALVTRLRAAGHDVVRLVRRPPRSEDEARWDPEAGTIDLERLHGLDAAVNLAGANVGDRRWTPEFKRLIRDSRVLATRTLAIALPKLDPLPAVLVNASAVGFYGSRGDEILTEESSGGQDFLADVVRAWEAETRPVADAGIRVALARTGLPMSANGGAFGPLLPLLRFGLGGPLGSGRQWWPWLTLDDEVRAVEFLLTGDLSGPVNLSAPEPARQRDVMRAIAARLHRPALLPAPRIALRVVLGEFADSVVASQRMVPRRLLDAGFRFTHPTLEQAADWLIRPA